MYKAPMIKRKTILSVMTLIVMFMITLTPLAAYAGTDSLEINVEQINTLEDETFVYKLLPLEPDNPMPEGSTTEGYLFTIKGNTCEVIRVLNFVRPGIYYYELFQEIETEKPGYTYDKRIYTLEVYVDELLEVEMIAKYKDDGKKAGLIVFENNIEAMSSDPSLMTDPPVKKTVTGSPGTKSEFSFRLEARDPSYPMPDGSVNGRKTISIKGSGEGEFGVWSYDKAGTYYYTVYEVNTGIDGYAYDNVVYTITDTVSEENGQLTLSRIVTNNMNKPVTALSFINKYSSGNSGLGNLGNGSDGPKTGDDLNSALYLTLFAAGAVLAAGSVISLIVFRKRAGGVKDEQV